MDPHSITPIGMNLPGLRVHESSIIHHEAMSYSLVESDDGQNHLAVEAPVQSTYLADFDGKSLTIRDRALLLCPLNAKNASALRKRLAWLQPSVQGLRTGIGFGDRLGLATPGHLRALRESKGHMLPFPAQQSIREMNRSARLERAPLPSSLSDAALPALLEQFDAREILHVTFGTILTRQAADGHRLFYERLMALLLTHSEAYAANLQVHFLRHLQPFVHWETR